MPRRPTSAPRWIASLILVGVALAFVLAWLLRERPTRVLDLPNSVSQELFPHLPPARDRALPAP